MAIEPASLSSPSLVTVLLKVAGRFLLAALVTVVAIPLTMLFAFLSGTGGSIISFGTFVMLVAAGWALLPALRLNAKSAVVATAVWGALGIWLATIGAQGVRGWMLGPWLAATVVNVILLSRRPPRFITFFKQ